jgi:hypothetical protein
MSKQNIAIDCNLLDIFHYPTYNVSEIRYTPVFIVLTDIFIITERRKLYKASYSLLR